MRNCDLDGLMTRIKIRGKVFHSRVSSKGVYEIGACIYVVASPRDLVYLTHLVSFCLASVRGIVWAVSGYRKRAIECLTPTFISHMVTLLPVGCLLKHGIYLLIPWFPDTHKSSLQYILHSRPFIVRALLLATLLAYLHFFVYHIMNNVTWIAVLKWLE